MNDTEIGPGQTDEEAFTEEVSDESLEAACYARAGAATTLVYGSYCFTCWKDEKTG